MNPTLDEIESKPKLSKTFSKLSFAFAVVSLILIGYLFGQIPSQIKASDGLTQPPRILAVVANFLVIIGIVMTVLSFSKKEPTTWMKWVGGILNSIFFVMVIGSIIFAKVIDAGH
ncbi:MAG: hypothetical protein AAB316_24525 [Bacteroidota bacterium]